MLSAYDSHGHIKFTVGVKNLSEAIIAEMEWIVPHLSNHFIRHVVLNWLNLGCQIYSTSSNIIFLLIIVAVYLDICIDAIGDSFVIFDEDLKLYISPPSSAKLSYAESICQLHYHGLAACLIFPRINHGCNASRAGPGFVKTRIRASIPPRICYTVKRSNKKMQRYGCFIQNCSSFQWFCVEFYWPGDVLKNGQRDLMEYCDTLRINLVLDSAVALQTAKLKAYDTDASTIAPFNNYQGNKNWDP